jgi:hypothetical protein
LSGFLPEVMAELDDLSGSYGKYYGYPDCCIREFHTVLRAGCKEKRRKLKQKKEINYLVSNGSGFIPCDMHAMKIYKKEIALSELIKDRECPHPFSQ